MVSAGKRRDGVKLDCDGGFGGAILTCMHWTDTIELDLHGLPDPGMQFQARETPGNVFVRQHVMNGLYHVQQLLAVALITVH